MRIDWYMDMRVFIHIHSDTTHTWLLEFIFFLLRIEINKNKINIFDPLLCYFISCLVLKLLPHIYLSFDFSVYNAVAHHKSMNLYTKTITKKIWK